MAIKLSPPRPFSPQAILMNQLLAGWKHSTRLTVIKNEPMNKLLANYWYKNQYSGFWQAKWRGWGKALIFTECLMCQITETISSLGPSWRFLWAVLYRNNQPPPLQASVNKECRGILSWYQDKEGIWILPSHFPLSLLCLLVGAMLRNVAQPLGNGMWIIP